MVINRNYLRLPFSFDAQKRSLCFFEHGKLVFDLRVMLDLSGSPDGYYHYDISRFCGRDIDFKVDGTPFPPEFADSPATNETESLRPVMHFTAGSGWINDPNGLVYAGGNYHLFFQHNPVGPLWDNMHWGHAVSNDLITWERLGDALFPDELGTMYSGSGIVDENNLSGLAEGCEKPILLFYTAYGNAAYGGNAELSKDRDSCQCVAYSNDGGKSFKKYAGNPVITGYSCEARDPKVVFAPELGRYLLALYIECNDFMLFVSDDLLNWKEFQKITLQGDSECPDLYPLTADDGARKWIFSAASDFYLVGNLTEDGFIPIQSEKRLCRGDGRYASQTYSGTCRRIKTGWGTTPAPGQLFNNQISCFTEVTLRKCSAEYYLCEYPVKEYSEAGETLFEGEAVPEAVFDGPGLDISVESGNRVTVHVGETAVVSDPESATISVGDDVYSLVKSSGELRILSDTLGFEVFADGGLIYLSFRAAGDKTVKIVPDGRAELLVRRTRIEYRI